VDFQTLLLKGRRGYQTAPSLGRVRSSRNQRCTPYFGNDVRFEMRAAQRRVISKIAAKFHAFHPRKN